MIMGFLKKKKEVKEDIYDEEDEEDQEDDDDSDDLEYKEEKKENKFKKDLKKNPQEKVIIEREVTLSLLNEKLNFLIEQLNEIKNS